MSEAVQPVVLVLDLVLGLVAVADLLSLRGAGRFRVFRQSEATCSLGHLLAGPAPAGHAGA